MSESATYLRERCKYLLAVRLSGRQDHYRLYLSSRSSGSGQLGLRGIMFPICIVYVHWPILDQDSTISAFDLPLARAMGSKPIDEPLHLQCSEADLMVI